MTKALENNSDNKWVAITKQVYENANHEQFEALLNALKQEVGKGILEAQVREELRQQVGADEATANTWKTIDDVLNHIDIVSLAENNPDMIKNAVGIVLNIIAIYFPVVRYISGAVAQIPDSIVVKIAQLGGVVTPEHLLHKTAGAMANRKMPTADSGERLALDFIEDYPDLTIVCKDEMLADTILKLIEEDEAESICPIIFNEKAWLAQQDSSRFDGKILFVGNVKGNDTLKSIIDVRFNRHGVTYGWTGNRASIDASDKTMKDKQAYYELIKEMQTLPVPEKYKTDLKVKLDKKFAAKALLATPLLIKDHFDAYEEVRRQQLLYGIFELCKNDLRAFVEE